MTPLKKQIYPPEVPLLKKTLQVTNQQPSFAKSFSYPKEQQRAIRRIAAIMVTDIARFTEMISEDEEMALNILHENRRIQKNSIERHEGTWIKEMGDGILSSFNSPLRAVLCALDIQKAVEKVSGLILHIGIHLSKVVFLEDDIFGLGVNIAFRIQEVTLPGQIWVSESVVENANYKDDFVTRLVTRRKLKNVKEPLKIYEINWSGAS